jgi:AraC family transcriptional activator of pyochelin receptor
MDAVLMDRLPVSPEMICLVGPGVLGDVWFPEHSAAFVVDSAGGSFRYHARADAAPLDAGADQPRLILLIAGAACTRLLGRTVAITEGRGYHLPANLRSIAMAIHDCTLPEEARLVYRGAKCIELLCETLRLDADDELVPYVAEAGLSSSDSQRLVAARRVIEERWAEKLTLDTIARACGLNRAKLTRGFRDMFDCSVADAIAEQRLEKARQLLLVTDLPVSSIGYRCGYLNNASFARAFSRHFGAAPTQYRAARLAA